LKQHPVKLMYGSGIKDGIKEITMIKKIMLSIIIISLFGCYDMNTLSVKPSTTTVTYGRDNSTGEKDAKNDVLTNTEKTSWTIKQVFKWE
jgi:hypothetical protein